MLRDYAAMGAMFGGLNAFGKSKLHRSTPEMRSYNKSKANQTSRMMQVNDADPTLYTTKSTREVEYGVPNAKLVPTTRSGKTNTGQKRTTNVRAKSTKGSGGQRQVRRDTKLQGGSGTVDKWDRVVTGAPVANARCSAGHESHIAPGYLLV